MMLYACSWARPVCTGPGALLLVLWLPDLADRDPLQATTVAIPEIDQGTNPNHRREHGGQNTDHVYHRKTTDGTGTEGQQSNTHNQTGQVGVKNSGPGAIKTQAWRGAFRTGRGRVRLRTQSSCAGSDHHAQCCSRVLWLRAARCEHQPPWSHSALAERLACPLAAGSARHRAGPGPAPWGGRRGWPASPARGGQVQGDGVVGGGRRGVLVQFALDQVFGLELNIGGLKTETRSGAGSVLLKIRARRRNIVFLEQLFNMADQVGFKPDRGFGAGNLHSRRLTKQIGQGIDQADRQRDQDDDIFPEGITIHGISTTGAEMATPDRSPGSEALQRLDGAFRQNSRNGHALDQNFNRLVGQVGHFNGQVVVVNFADFAQQTTGSDDFVAFGQIEMQIVQGIQTRAGNFIGTLQMMQVATREMLASMAGAAGVQRAGVIAVAGIAYFDVAVTGKQPAIARIAGGHDAVKHIHTLADPFHQVFRCTHTHEIAGGMGGQFRSGVRQNAHHVFFGLAYGQAANGVALKADFGQASQGFVAQVFVHAALHNAKQGVGIGQLLEFLTRTAGPAQGHAHGSGRFIMRGGAVVNQVGRAFVEHHGNVGVQGILDLHGHFRGQEQALAGDGGGKFHPFFGNLAHAFQAEHLKTARIRQDGLVPLHEVVQALVLVHDLRARTQPQVEGVAQDDLRANLVQFVRHHGLDAAIRAYRHEDGGLHHTVVQGDLATASGAIGA
uniref:TonB_dep_Rec domain-containing protein n=1 Tax=Parastrongyloides trichosuri TaxID=131310 RepID=A0A0N4ZLY8_PARTI